MFQPVALILATSTALADSSNARWPARPDNTLRVWIASPSLVVEGDSTRANAVRRAFLEWNRVGLPVRFRFSTDSASADVRVMWTDRFDRPMSGSTTTLDDDSAIYEADMLLAVNHWNGPRLSLEELRVMTLHEIGHVLGLTHSTDPRSVMAPVVRVRRISASDRAAVRKLYAQRTTQNAER